LLKAVAVAEYISKYKKKRKRLRGLSDEAEREGQLYLRHRVTRLAFWRRFSTTLIRLGTNCGGLLSFTTSCITARLARVKVQLVDKRL
jgi:hypothetical protein